MFDTNNLADEDKLAERRHRLYGPWPLINVKVDHALFSPKKGTLYLLSGAAKIFKVYARRTEPPHTQLAHNIVGISNAAALEGGTIRAIDRIDHVAEMKAGKPYFYSRLMLHTQKGFCTILCEDLHGRSAGTVSLQMEEADKYPPDDSAPLEDFAYPLPHQRFHHG